MKSKMLYIAVAIAIAGSVTTTSAPANIHGVNVFNMTVTQSPDDETGEAFEADLEAACEAGWCSTPVEAGEALAEFEAEQAELSDEPSNAEVDAELVKQVETLTGERDAAIAEQGKAQTALDKANGEIKSLKSAATKADKAATNAKDEITSLKGQVETLTAELAAATAATPEAED